MVVLGKVSSIKRFLSSSLETRLCNTGMLFHFRHPFRNECSIIIGATCRVAKISGQKYGFTNYRVADYRIDLHFVTNRASVPLCEKKNCTQRHRGTVLNSVILEEWQ
jgi:hypothetical protein